MMMAVFLALCCLVAGSVALFSSPALITVHWVTYTVCMKNPDMEPARKMLLSLAILRSMYGRLRWYLIPTPLVTSIVAAKIAELEGDSGCQL